MTRFVPSMLLAGALALGSRAAPVAAQEAQDFLAVGETAPDVELVGATRYGVIEGPVRLSDFRGETIVLAFFFKARTRG